MRPYLAILAACTRALLQYRAAAAAGVVTQFFWGLLRVMIFTAFYRSTNAVQPLSLPDLVTYIWLGQALLMLLPWRPDSAVEEMIRTGNIAYELVKPVDLHGLWMARAIADRAAPTALRALPVTVVALALLDMRSPPSWQAALLFAIGVLGAVLLGASVCVLLTLSLFWTVSSRGMIAVSMGLVNLLSGLLIPLQLFPEWAQPALAWQPFRGLSDTPFRLYLGNLSGRDAVTALLLQFGWAIVLTLVGRALLTHVQRRVVVQGG